jgi:hypothetical protein
MYYYQRRGAENAEMRRDDLNSFLCGSQRSLLLCVKIYEIERLTVTS